MNNALAAEWLKQRTTRTMLGIGAAMVGTVTIAAVVHILGFTSGLIDQRVEQRSIMLDIGVGIGLVFAVITGAVSITSEFRHGTIRSTLLRHPKRTDTLAAKAITQLTGGAVIAAAAAGYAIGLTSIFLQIRGLEILLSRVDIVTLVAGAAFGGAMFALIGLATGTLVRSQVPVVVGALLWMLFIEPLLRAGVPAIAKFAPGSLARSVAGQTGAALSSRAVAGAAIAGLTIAVSAAAHRVFLRRDIA